MNTPDQTPLELFENNPRESIIPDGFVFISKERLLELERQAACYRSLGGEAIEGKLEGKLSD